MESGTAGKTVLSFSISRLKIKNFYKLPEILKGKA